MRSWTYKLNGKHVKGVIWLTLNVVSQTLRQWTHRVGQTEELGPKYLGRWWRYSLAIFPFAAVVSFWVGTNLSYSIQHRKETWYLNWARWYCDRALDFYSGGTRFEYRPRHQLSCLRICVASSVPRSKCSDHNYCVSTLPPSCSLTINYSPTVPITLHWTE
jgi:hypothetical protein